MTGVTTCKQCGVIYSNAHWKSCPSCSTTGPGVTYAPPLTYQDRMCIEWEKIKPLIPDGELKTFICSAIQQVMEKWSGGNPPRAKVLTVEVVEPCGHENEGYDGDFTTWVCKKCGRKRPAVPFNHKNFEWMEEPSTPHPVSPFAGGNIG